MISLLNGNALAIPLVDKTVQCVVTSPPYFGLRDYGTAKWEGGLLDCDHSPARKNGDGSSTLDGGKATISHKHEGYHTICGKCGAVRVDNPIGLESTPAEYVAHLVAVFAEVWRVLRDDGTCWVNLGDSYTSGDRSTWRSGASDNKGQLVQNGMPRPKQPPDLKPKDLMGIPWRVAFALQADGWYLRQDIIWAKAVSGEVRMGIAMPESVRDRCCKSHEYLFLLTKSERYYFDTLAIADEIDNTKSHEYNMGYEEENLFTMQDSENAEDVQQEQSAIGRSDGDVQGVSFSNPQEVQSQIQPNIESEGDSEAVLLFQERAGGKEGIPSSICFDRGTKREIQGSDAASREGTEVQGTQKKILAKSKGEKAKGRKGQQIQENGKGKILKAQDRDQAQASDQDHGLHPDQERMGSNQREVWESVRVLRKAGALRDGSRNPPEQRWNTHGEQHSSSLPNVQRKEKQLLTATRRSVWLVNPQPFSGAHFATFPPALVEPCILAGTSPQACEHCGAPWKRVIQNDNPPNDGNTESAYAKGTSENRLAMKRQAARERGEEFVNRTSTIGWCPTCACPNNTGSGKCIILDPFVGSGTTLTVAAKHGRSGVGIELSMPYIELAKKRLAEVQPLLIGM